MTNLAGSGVPGFRVSYIPCCHNVNDFYKDVYRYVSLDPMFLLNVIPS